MGKGKRTLSQLPITNSLLPSGFAVPSSRHPRRQVLQAGKPFGAVAHGGNPQDRAASPDGDATRTPTHCLPNGLLTNYRFAITNSQFAC
ncbi:hypothetical protein PI95_021990 [Hassallia byssoidea VB512170]|uniref:Uncharacterized protein n=1 Tax=Hassallia byssoidea VB512170 TaxID=1304833 RepID=A0A846HCU3_9CYAN|nr:hypothetical protein [Hassalia byssoidea]NEU75156.1 hypothetical protein [Hassalia byssoidea VB512170]